MQYEQGRPFDCRSGQASASPVFLRLELLHSFDRLQKMKLRFNREVRKSIADELKKVSTFGGIALGVLGYSINAPIVLLGAFLWWIACQVIATLLLAMEVNMTMELAALLGMAAVLVFGLVALLWAFIVSGGEKSDNVRQHHA